MNKSIQKLNENIANYNEIMPQFLEDITSISDSTAGTNATLLWLGVSLEKIAQKIKSGEPLNSQDICSLILQTKDEVIDESGEEDEEEGEDEENEEGDETEKESKN